MQQASVRYARVCNQHVCSDRQGEPSFLDLIPELRNAVYDILFKRRNQVVIAQGRPCNLANSYECPCDRLESQYGLISAFFVHGFQQGLSLLRTCRQVHQEASGVLYGSNTFIIAKPDDPHILPHIGLQRHHLEYASTWLPRLRNQQSRLTRVLIDVSAMCHLDNPHVYVTFDLLPLLRLIWKQPELADALSFKHLNRRRPYDDPGSTGPAINDYDDAIEMRAVYLNNILRSLGRNDGLSVKRYAHFQRLLHSIPVGPQRGSVFLKRATTDEAVLYRAFNTVNAGTGLRMLSVRGEEWDSGLPLSLWKRIYQHISQPTKVVVHLDTHRVSGVSLSLLYINRGLQVAMICHVLRSCTITIRLTFNSNVADCKLFDSAQSPGCKSICSKVSPSIFAASVNVCHYPYTLWLVFKLPTITTLADIRVNISVFVGYLCNNRTRSSSSLDVTLVCETDAHRCTDYATVELVKIEQRLFLLLSDVVSHLSIEDLADDPKFPEIWVNGHGELLEARCLATRQQDVMVQNQYQDINQEEVLSQGNGMKRDLEGQVSSYLEQDRYSNTSRPSLLSAWQSLRYKYWKYQP